jgi:hypothetical protein
MQLAKYAHDDDDDEDDHDALSVYKKMVSNFAAFSICSGDLAVYASAIRR